VNIQTEHLDDHTARLTVEVEADRLEKAIQQAARRIAKKGRIPGFRPGKAPVQVVLNLYGKEYVLGEALDELGNDLYREALEASEVQPYAPGSLEKVEEEGRKLVFVVPKRPEVDLGNYRDLRIEYTVEEVTDEMLDEAMENLRQDQALVEPVERPAQMGDQVTFDHFEVVVLPNEGEAAVDSSGGEVSGSEGEPAVEAGDEAEQEDDEQEHVLVHQHDFDRVLRDDEDDLFPGFSAEIVGLQAGDEKTFTLAIPEDYDLKDAAGHTVRVEAFVKAVQSRLVPDWSDTLAEVIAKGELKTMLELRVDTRKRLGEMAERMATDKAAHEALDKLVEGATIHYPEEIVQEYIDDLMTELDQNLRQQGLTLADLLKITGRKEETVREEYRERAVERARRALALGQLVQDEELAASDEDLEAEIDRMSSLLGGDQAGKFRQFLTTEQSRMNIANRVASDRALARLVAIAKGENPPKGPTAAPADEAADAPPSAGVPAETSAAE
jgi:trigger factor